MGVRESDASSRSCWLRDPGLLATAHWRALRFHLAGPGNRWRSTNLGTACFANKRAVHTNFPRTRFLVSRSENTSFRDLGSEARPTGLECFTVVAALASVAPLFQWAFLLGQVPPHLTFLSLRLPAFCSSHCSTQSLGKPVPQFCLVRPFVASVCRGAPSPFRVPTTDAPGRLN